MEEDKPDYWFPIERRFGRGWGPPVKWQGWLVWLTCYVLVLVGLLKLRHDPDRLMYLVLLTLIMYGIHRLKGERRDKHEAATQSPKSVSMAVKAIWIMIVVTGIVTTANVVESARQQKSPFAFGLMLMPVLVAYLGFLAWINLRIEAGRAWAAIVYFIFTALLMLSAAQSVPLLFGISPVRGVLGIVAITLNSGSALLLLRRESRAWFFTRNGSATVA